MVCFPSAGRTYATRVENLRELVEEERARGTRHSMQDLTDMFRVIHVNTMMNIIARIVIELREEEGLECQ